MSKKLTRKQGFVVLFAIGFIAMVTLIIIAGGIFVYKLDQEMLVKMQQKQLIRPTIFYSRAPTWKSGDMFPLEEIKIILNKQLRLRTEGQRLFAGDYQILPTLSCQTFLGAEGGSLQQDDLCLQIFWDQGGHPGFREPWMETLWLDSESRVKGVFSGESPTVIEQFTLKPQIVAQYLGEEPILWDLRALPDFPVSCLNAIIAIEDAQFLEHSGVSPIGILRAVAVNLIKGRKAQGGSTLTQQLIKNYFLTPEKTIKRKVIEFIMALLIESHFDKDLILETYLNIIYMGQQGPYQVRGYGAAARHYFQKAVSDLSLAQCSLLAAIVNSPGQYNPFTYPDKAKARRSLVLQKMEEQKLITVDERRQAEAEPLPMDENIDLYSTLPYFLQAAADQAKKLGFGDLSGHKLFTTMDLRLQEAAQAAIVKNLKQIEEKVPTVKKVNAKKKINLESALVSIDVDTGGVRALVGGRSFRKTQFNRILTSKRQVGSTFKPFVYLTALASGDDEINPLYELKDEPFTYEYGKQKWTPENYDRAHYGKVPMYFALKESLNLATAQLALNLGLDTVIEMARRLGIYSDLRPVPSLSLGAFELNPLELSQAYLTIARFGDALPLTFLDAVVDGNGEVVWSSEVREGEEKVSAVATQILIGMLKQTAITGTAKKVNQSGFDKIVAGKTGTTNDYRDSWFIGFTPDLLSLVWTGYDDNTSSGLTGASGSLPAWLDFMREATKYDLVRDFSWTEDVSIRSIPIYELKSKGFWTEKDVSEPDEIELVFRK